MAWWIVVPRWCHIDDTVRRVLCRVVCPDALAVVSNGKGGSVVRFIRAGESDAVFRHYSVGYCRADASASMVAQTERIGGFYPVLIGRCFHRQRGISRHNDTSIRQRQSMIAMRFFCNMARIMRGTA